MVAGQNRAVKVVVRVQWLQCSDIQLAAHKLLKDYRQLRGGL